MSGSPGPLFDALPESAPNRQRRINELWIKLATVRILHASGVAPSRWMDERRPVAALLRRIIAREDRASILDRWVRHARECADGSCQNPMAAWTARVKKEI